MIEDLVGKLFEIHAPLAYILVFAFAFAEGPLLLGFIVPGEVATIVGGALVRFGNASAIPMVIAAALGAMGGDTIGFWTGRWLGPWFLKTRLGRWFERNRFPEARRYLEENGGKAIVIGRFTAALRVVLPGVCGMSRMSYFRFLGPNALGCTLWAVAMVALGYVAGAAWEKAQKLVGALSFVILGAVIVGFFVARHLRRKRRRKKSEREAGSR